MDALPVVLTIITASTPLLLAATGELVTEKAGVLNLGVEGMMLVGAIAAFATAVSTGSGLLAILVGAFSGVAVAAIFAVLTLTFLANQVATGLALTIFGVGLSALIGSSFVGISLEPLPQLNVEFLSTIPILGELLFGHDVLVYLSFIMILLAGYFFDQGAPNGARGRTKMVGTAEWVGSFGRIKEGYERRFWLQPLNH